MQCFLLALIFIFSDSVSLHPFSSVAPPQAGYPTITPFRITLLVFIITCISTRFLLTTLCSIVCATVTSMDLESATTFSIFVYQCQHFFHFTHKPIYCLQPLVIAPNKLSKFLHWFPTFVPESLPKASFCSCWVSFFSLRQFQTPFWKCMWCPFSTSSHAKHVYRWFPNFTPTM